MTNVYFIQLIGVLLTAAGIVALTATTHLYGTPLSAEERRNLGRKLEHRNWYRLPIRLETLASTAVFLGGMGILAWSKFNLCGFLAYWLPSLPEALRIFMSCR
jgi:hypothetical protein